MTIRPARPEDAARIAEIHRQSVEAQDCTMAEALEAAHVVQRLASLGAGEALLVAERAGAVLGWGEVKAYSPRPGYRCTCETAIYLDRQHRGQGLGGPLQQALMEHCQQAGYHHVVAKIWASNQPSLRFHQRFGYTLVGVQQQVGYIGGQWRDVAILQKLLDNPCPSP